jgi:geranylgeranyl pyrophosphate synthase
LLTFKACTAGKESKEDFKRAMEGTVSMELAHTTSLVHDDIIDKDDLRRGKGALNIEEGLGSALLLGHKMLIFGYQIALKHGPMFARLFVDTWRDALSGELMEIQFNERKKKRFWPSSDLYSYYMVMNDLKTATLFSSACKLGAMEAYMNEETTGIFEKFGLEVGRAYQLADDLLDIRKGEFGDSIIFPLLERIENEKINPNHINKRILRKKIKANMSLIEKFYKDEIEKHIKIAESLIQDIDIPESIFKEMLIEAPRYLIDIKFHEN